MANLYVENCDKNQNWIMQHKVKVAPNGSRNMQFIKEGGSSAWLEQNWDPWI